MLRLATLSLSVLIMTACQRTITLPDTRSASSWPAKRATYINHKLTLDDGFFWRNWHRQDGVVREYQLRALAAPYPETEAVLRERNWRLGTMTSAVVVGTVLATTAIGLSVDSIGSHGGKDYDSTLNTLWGTAAGFLVLPVIISLVWRDPLDEFHSTYNDALRRDLQLPPEL